LRHCEISRVLSYIRLLRRWEDGTIRPIRRFVDAGGGANFEGVPKMGPFVCSTRRKGTTLAKLTLRGPVDQRFEGE
jgi:hypothetical protein